MTHISFIGLGIMGSRMATNLLKAGYSLTIHNRTQEKAAELVQQGARWADTPIEAAHGADILITMLAHPQAVESMALDAQQGFLPHLKAGAIWVDCSTVNPMFARRMASEAHARGVRFVDAPVAGSKQVAQEGRLVFYVGGDDETVQACADLFAKMGQKVNHVGAVGMGIAFKVVLNHLLATSMLAFAEALILGQSLGISRDMLLNTIVGGPLAAPYLVGKRGKIESGDFEADFPLQWMQKDLQMVAETAFETGTAMPVSNVAKELYQLAARYGYGEQDFAAIYAFLNHNR
jgi:3-hydroxyisobutyrate dehydrogenase-like beta-hydroxyacid dehydrogenase